MGVMDWLSRLFGKGDMVKINGQYAGLVSNVYVKKLVIESCIDMIANALSRSTFKTYEKGKEVRKDNYYLLNVQPNQNQNASEFMHSLVNHLFYNNECLVIMQNGQLYVADDFEVLEAALKENLYKNVTIKNFTFDKVFSESDVMHFKLNDRNIMQVIDGLYQDYGLLISSAIDYYKRKNNKRYLIKGDFIRAQDNETQKAVDSMFEMQLKDWFDPNKTGSAFQLQDGYNFEDMSDNSKGAKNDSTTRDIADLINDVINYVSMAFHVPRGLLKGDLADIEKQIDGFLMFAVLPTAKLIQEEFNRKLYPKEKYLERTYLKLHTHDIKIVDFIQLATAVDKLFAVGGLTIDDIIERLGGEPLNTEWSTKRYVTKNYAEAVSLEGGENNE